MQTRLGISGVVLPHYGTPSRRQKYLSFGGNEDPPSICSTAD
jgi:hypothetical protein